jgi:hypothetical protein
VKIEILKEAVLLAKNIGHVLIATADAKGRPHMAAAGRIILISAEGSVAVEDWFCPGTMANLQANRNTALIIWDPKMDKGYQLLGKTEKVKDTAMMNGYVPNLEDKPALPQVERQLLIRVNKIMAFRHSQHTDQEE